jgi:hypothetical protein
LVFGSTYRCEQRHSFKKVNSQTRTALENDGLLDVAPDVIYQGDALMTEAVSTSEMSPISTRLHGVTSQMTVIFILAAVRI